jgi:hypothetical protein
LPFPPEPAPGNFSLAVEGWNMMQGIDWQALPVIVEMLGIEDVDLYIRQLLTIRNFHDHLNKP